MTSKSCLNSVIIQGRKVDIKSKSGSSPGEYLAVSCPFCGRNKFYINVLKKKFSCKHCSKEGSYKEEDEDVLMDSESLDEIRSLLKIQKKEKSEQPYILNLDEFSKPLNSEEFPIGYQYMIDRGFSDEMIQKYFLRGGTKTPPGSVYSSRWIGRVVFPFIIEGRAIYAIGRAYSGGSPKYLNTQTPKTAILYNYDNLSSEVILCEGIISSINAERTTGISSTALLGKTLSNSQVKLLKEKGVSTVYLSLDGEVTRRENNQIIKKLLYFGFRTYFVELPYGMDPDDCKDSYIEYFKKAQRVVHI